MVETSVLVGIQVTHTSYNSVDDITMTTHLPCPSRDVSVYIIGMFKHENIH